MVNRFEGDIRVKEKEPQYRLQHIITISGEAGTGKSFAVDTLAEMYQLNTNRVIKVGEMFRNLAFQTTGRKMEGYFERPLKVDIDIDTLQLSLLTDPRPKIIDSRLGAWLAQHVRQAKSNPLPITSIILSGQEDVLRQRVYHRDNKANPSLTLEESIRQTAERKRRDLEQWRKVHADLPITYPQGLKEPPIAVDVTSLNKEAAIAAIHGVLLRIGALGKIQDQSRSAKTL